MRLRIGTIVAAAVLAAVATVAGFTPAEAPPTVVHDVYTVYRDVVTYDPNSDSVFDISCNAGDKVISGGYDLPNVGPSIVVWFNRPPDVNGVPSTTTWRIIVHYGVGYPLRVVATCADL